jgi:transcriptional regulator of aromatic amino acid metabolism
MSTHYIVEAWHPNTKYGDAITSAQIMVRDYDPEMGHQWRHKKHTNRSFDYALGHSRERENTVAQAIRLRLQKEPVTVAYGGETKRGYLYIVTVTD